MRGENVCEGMSVQEKAAGLEGVRPVHEPEMYRDGEGEMNKPRITISDVGDLASKILAPKYSCDYILRRDLIVSWLKERKISVWGRRRQNVNDK